ncbi:Hypothetical protein CAP_2234 [Chondromyces apiculatus DSM 436]|uniref:Uncharacterized protein n=1 Tax=Chondromyces apiculatus DSM 436 TaxID=1192034 RepID=A0A017TA14_9BACT|nr:Hypothetical protein CAP_2234 [Chondromyces apiculatus DSM 436]
MLVDVTEQARKAGFKIPVALTGGVWARCVEMTEAAEKAGNSEDSRLSDLLWMARAAAAQKPDAREVDVRLHVVTDSPKAALVELTMQCGPGDDGEPVITIMLPGED